ncbi:hypothetical protein SanaruYs_30310 [Chryseotalea sanaruensis]|uniref:Tetratricopeptide repeat protein n=1 Tax=Chryseotalea sanaruensis TaxID=2482724 RepID=A0A401UD65_9BACT|nr:DUF6624 domain-containing protein [Chryseotalea sanaruensis]GCC52792.1 hypothetical protein SanaruYs_30310 [Chryseotalea sanaruensis]
MKSVLSVLIYLTAITLNAQTFEEFVQNGEKLYNEKKFSESVNEYAKAFNIKEGNASQYYNAACAWALLGDTTQSIKYLNLSAAKGWKNLKHIKRDPDLTSLHSVLGWDKVLEMVKLNLDEYEKDFDKPLKEQLELIYVRDQTLRQLYQDAEKKFGRESEEMSYYWKLVSEQDSLNESAVIKIIEEKGWVGTSVVGGQANITLWLVIQHAPIETQEKYLPLLRESVKKGESSGSHLALLEDRIQMRNGKPQTFGSQIIRDEKTGKQVVYEIWEPAYVNQRRKEVGLGPIDEYVKRWGIEWTIEQKER